MADTLHIPRGDTVCRHAVCRADVPPLRARLVALRHHACMRVRHHTHREHTAADAPVQGSGHGGLRGQGGDEPQLPRSAEGAGGGDGEGLRVAAEGRYSRRAGATDYHATLHPVVHAGDAAGVRRTGRQVPMPRAVAPVLFTGTATTATGCSGRRRR